MRRSLTSQSSHCLALKLPRLPKFPIAAASIPQSLGRFPVAVQTRCWPLHQDRHQGRQGKGRQRTGRNAQVGNAQIAGVLIGIHSLEMKKSRRRFSQFVFVGKIASQLRQPSSHLSQCCPQGNIELVGDLLERQVLLNL